MSDGVSIYGIRHHGPGCARSLLKALQAAPPECVLIEGPAGCEVLLAHVNDAQLQPPVALLSHAVEDPQRAVFHPFAVFSPEWQAMQWAVRAGVPVRFMDVPPSVTLAWQRQAKAASEDSAPSAPTTEEGDDVAAPEIGDDAARVATPDASDDVPHDPLDWLARAAGYEDGESWWNHMVEERGDGEGLFEAIAQAMTELRENAQLKTRLDAGQEAIREAHMRSVLRETRQQGYQRIAVICGAWHVPAIAAKTTAAADQRLLKGLEKLKAQTTWVPWTYRHLSMRSGYGAGIASPGWYDHLWHNGGADIRAVAWFARIAHLLREHELDCSSAHLIEASRLADTLAALRQRPAPGLDELNEATRSVICNGDDAPMRLIAERLMLGDALGSVPSSVPTVPLQRDLEAQQKRLRLKPEALSRKLDLDLRNGTDLQRSHLLHRLNLLGIGWGGQTVSGRSARGTFHEVWDLAWEPHYEVELIVASRYGHTLELAATACAVERAGKADRLPELAALIDRVLLAHLSGAVQAVAAQLEARAATDADPLALLGALPALANVYRYGNVRKTDVAQVAHLFDGMLLRAGLGLPLALADLDGEAAEAARTVVLGADRAVELRQGEAQTQAWQRALRVVALAEGGTPLLRGLGTRLLLDAGVFSTDEAAQQISLNLSAGAEPLQSAQWLDGFLNRNAAVLLHGDVVWPLIDAWICGLQDEHFMRVVPLVRRSFAQFEAADRRDLSLRVKQPAGQRAAAASVTWDAARANRALPMLRELLGIADGR
ncbi:DUF5682 family protein [Dyella subtropica]|uniref:DUF5682 family protein n=1 Tax=Dyella subtropica TaxID=2992127 RepID=UPI00224CF858|nr:DUF5682 family protein [Dyella subtropica]